MLGNLIGEFKGRITNVRILPEGKKETSEQASGNILGIEATWLATSISTPMPDGIIMSDGNAIVTTKDNEVVMIKKSGIGWSTGNGQKSSRRGVFFHMTQSQKLACLNRIVGVWEFESEEDGNWHVEIWEWK
ncbi:MAG TPA: hypothetical protein VK209_12810 [Candidatus Sulfotelmatobacter sp.]|nr:hypothetical protein [Candidatus Sulfotelmatobacter sp.]